MKLTLLFVLTFVFLFPSKSFAWGLKELGEEISVPVSKDVRDVLIIGSALTLTAVIFEDVIDRGQSEVVEDKPLGSFSKYGDWAGQMVPNFLYIFGQSVAGAAGNDKGYDRAIGMFKATAYAASVTTVLKYTIREPRPNNHNDRNSFPSGHTTTAFAFGGYVFEEHGWEWGVPALLVSTFSGISRINDNMHRTQDVLAGATIGLCYGVGMAKLDKKNRKKDQQTSFNIVPLWDAEVKGLAMMGQF